jgi:hypothetical protein
MNVSANNKIIKLINFRINNKDQAKNSKQFYANISIAQKDAFTTTNANLLMERKN